VFVEDKSWQPPRFGDREQSRLHFIAEQPLGTGFGLALRAGCFETVGLFDEDMRAGSDTEFFVRLGQRYDFRVLPSVLVKSLRHSGPKLSGVPLRRARALAYIIKKHRGFFSRHPGLWETFHTKVSLAYYGQGKTWSACRWLLRGLARAPRSRKLLKLLVLVVLGRWNVERVKL
jgi:hypothetical protein